MLRNVFFFLICLTLTFSFRSKAQQANAVQVIITRHAEKGNGDAYDPGLSAAGRERAERLAQLLRETKVDRLYATPYKRTQQTLAPLAAAKNLVVAQYDPGTLKTFADAICKEKGKTIVVAGHANTAPALVNLLLGEERYSTLPEDAFGNMWLLTLKDGKALSCLLINTNYH